MTTLEQKLQQLNLKAMSRQIETTLAESAVRNLSVISTIELLVVNEPQIGFMNEGRALQCVVRSFSLQITVCQATQFRVNHWHKSF